MKFKYLFTGGLAATLFFSSCEKEEDLDKDRTTTEGASSDSTAIADSLSSIIIDNSVSLVGKWQVTDADFGFCDDNVNNNIKEVHAFTDGGTLEISCPNGVGEFSFN